ncbi:Sphingosine-1-phosphate lyase 1, partial [Fragariocoptes setiger]
KLNKKSSIQFITRLPIVKRIIDKKLDKIEKDLKHDLLKVYRNEEFIGCLPDKGLNPEVLLKKNQHYQRFDTVSWQQGRISGAIYADNHQRYKGVLLSIFSSHMWSNPLHSDVFASIRKMEAEIIRMVCTMYEANVETATGSVTSGGTESIILACKTYRDYAINVNNLKGRPEIVAPVTAHAAFEKAANLLHCKFVPVPVDLKTLKVDLAAMKRAITSKTCMLVVSAPQFPHGIIDPITQVSKIALHHNIPLHVDACLGGFLLPFMEEAGFRLDESFNFTVPGVTSISVDTHKYGFAPKGTSVVMYRHEKFIHQQYSVQTDWPGGIYASPTLPGSRPGALIATCWAALMFHGKEGYVKSTQRIISTSYFIRDELRKIKGIQVMGNPVMSVVSFKSDEFDIFLLNEKLKELGWNLNVLQFPSSIHLCVTLMHTSNNTAQSFIRDVNRYVSELLNGPKTKPSGAAAVYGMSQTIPDRSLVARIAHKYLDGCYGR